MSNYLLPSGYTARVASQRRFILVDFNGRILYRTDILDRAIAKRSSAAQYIIDTAGNGKVQVTTIDAANGYRRSTRWVNAEEVAALIAAVGLDSEAPAAPQPITREDEIAPIADVLESVARRLRSGAIHPAVALKVLRLAVVKLEEVK